MLEVFNHIYDEYFCYTLCILSKFRVDIVKFTSWELWNLCEHIIFFCFASYPWLWYVLFDFRVRILQISWSNEGWRLSNLGFWVKFNGQNCTIFVTNKKIYVATNHGKIVDWCAIIKMLNFGSKVDINLIFSI